MVGLFYGVGLAAVIAAIAHVSQGFLQDMPYFRLSRLQVHGVSAQMETDLQRILEQALSRNRNLLSLDLGEITRRIREHPRIRQLQLEKIYPDTLVIRASERQPEAIVNTDAFYFVDREGFVLGKVKPAELRGQELPFITGLHPQEVRQGEKILNPALYRALLMAQVLRTRNPELHAMFSEIHIESDPVTRLDSLTAHLKGGTEVRFGDGNPIDKLPALETFIALKREQGGDPFSALYIDLRFENQIVFMERERALAMAAGKQEQLKHEEMAKTLGESSGETGASPAKAKPRERADGPAAAKPRTSSGQRRESVPAARQVAVPPAAPAIIQQQPEPQPRRGLSRFAFWRRKGGDQANPSTPTQSPDPFAVR